MLDKIRLAAAGRLPEGWQAATVLERDVEGRYLAPNYLRFEDSPLLFSPTLASAQVFVNVLRDSLDTAAAATTHRNVRTLFLVDLFMTFLPGWFRRDIFHPRTRVAETQDFVK
jgi:hypothetical protein